LRIGGAGRNASEKTYQQDASHPVLTAFVRHRFTRVRCKFFRERSVFRPPQAAQRVLGDGRDRAHRPGVAKAAKYSMPALALTDNANVFGMVKFYKTARAAGIKPIIGVDCWIRNDSDREKPSRLLLLCASSAATASSPSCCRAPG
jgi:hypothetical protein